MSLLYDYYEVQKNRDLYPQNPHDDGKPILSPLDTELRIDCFIYDAQYISYPMDDGTYRFEFQIFSSLDYCKLESKIDEAAHLWDRSKGFALDKTSYNHIQTRYGTFVCSQLFVPKLNENSDDKHFGMMLAGREASLKLHFRDAPDGQIYLQCSYCDLYLKPEPDPIPALEDQVDEPWELME